jgi:RecA-family ATPase
MDKDAALALAKQYASLGVPAFPIVIRWDAAKRKTVKQPLTKHGHKDATTDPTQLVDLFASAHPNGHGELAVGLHPGPGGFVVLDVDVKGSVDGKGELEKLQEEYGNIPATPVAVTSSGGFHIWLKKDPTSLVGNSPLTNGVDVRADDGWVVAPGVDTQWGSWDWVPDYPTLSDAAEWPDWVANRIGGTGKLTGKEHWQALDRTLLDEADLELLELVESEVIGGHSARWQNDCIYVCKPGKKGGVGASIGWIAPGVMKVWDTDWVCPDGRELPEGVYSITELERWIATGDKEPVVAGDQPIAVRPETKKKRLRDRLLDLDGIELIEPPTYLIDRYLVRDTLALLFADPGVGKSFLAIDWMMHVATGQDWQGFEVKKSEPVFYIVAEGVAGFGLRTKAWKQFHGKSKDECAPVLMLDGAANLSDGSTDGDVAQLLEIVEEQRPALIVIDTLARSSVGSDENWSKDMNIIVHNADALRRASGACVLILHHTGHQNKDRERGSSSLHGAIDTRLQLVGSSNGHMTLKVTKQKDDEEAEAIQLVRHQIPLEGTDKTSCVVLSADDEVVEEKEVPLPKNVQEILKALYRVQVSNGIPRAKWIEAWKDMTGKRHDKPFSDAHKWIKDNRPELLHNHGTDSRPLYTTEHVPDGKIVVTVSSREVRR